MKTLRRNLEVPNLRRRLVVLDSAALTVAWLPALIWKYLHSMELWKICIVLAVLLSTGLALFHLQGLYLARVASSRTEEVRRIFRVSILLGVLQSLLLRWMGVDFKIDLALVGPILCFILLMWFRGGYRAWLSAARAAGHHLRDVVILGANADAADLVAMLREHPEAGFRARGVVGDPTLAAVHGLGSLHLGTIDQLMPLLRQHSVRGVIAVVGALPARELTAKIAELEAADIHIQVSNGLYGMSYRRLRATPVAYQSLYYLEPSESGSPQLLVKRWFDIAMAAVVLLLASPLMLAVAIAIKLDGGPVFFRQQRVGRNGKTFGMFKFRSMVVDAEERLAALKAANQRKGPLFKLESDPRVTRVGRFIRSTSIDELPQLFNVLKGDMSVVGPRPALPSEIAQFDDRLLERLHMLPGITGLWQVEARDNPHFGAYRRLDLFYVDNWSLNLDLVILIATIEQVFSRALRAITGRGRTEARIVDIADEPLNDDVLRSA
jgi:exopolysaccharide biosynthesis polyprenyl glycosylphosphotransferase